MNEKEKKLVKTLNKIGVDTRFISIYENNIYINNLKISKFSRKKEEEFRQEYPEIEVSRSKLLQKICIKVSRTVKNQIKPRQTLYIPDDSSLENIILYIVLEPYKRKYGIRITDTKTPESVTVSSKCSEDFSLDYLNLITHGEKIEDKLEENTIYPLMHVSNQWINDWISSTQIEYKTHRVYEKTIETEIHEFLEEHVPNVNESIKQSVNYLNNINEGEL